MSAECTLDCRAPLLLAERSAQHGSHDGKPNARSVGFLATRHIPQRGFTPHVAKPCCLQHYSLSHSNRLWRRRCTAAVLCRLCWCSMRGEVARRAAARRRPTSHPPRAKDDTTARRLRRMRPPHADCGGESPPPPPHTRLTSTSCDWRGRDGSGQCGQSVAYVPCAGCMAVRWTTHETHGSRECSARESSRTRSARRVGARGRTAFPVGPQKGKWNDRSSPSFLVRLVVDRFAAV